MSSNTVVAVIVAALPVSVPFLAALYRLLISQLPAAKRGQIAAVVKSAVVAAEQVYKNIPGSSQAKKEFVVSRVQSVFGKRVSAALVEVLLEEAVASLPAPQPSHTAI